jgi:hypothetical protein
MNEHSRERANRLLGEIAGRTAEGDVWIGSAVTLGERLGFENAVEAARAVRALITRGRIEVAGGGYRLLDASPVAAGERTSPAHRSPAARNRPTPAVGVGAVGTAGAAGAAGPDGDLAEQVRALREEVRALRTLVATIIADPNALGRKG